MVDKSSGVISSVGVDLVDTTRAVDAGVTVDTVVGEEGDVDIVVGAGGDTGVDAVSSEVISSSGCAVDISSVVETSLEVDIVDFDDGVDVVGVEGGVELVEIPCEVAVEIDEFNSSRVISAVVSDSGLSAVSSLDIVADTFSSFLSWAALSVSFKATSASLDPVMKLTSLSHSSWTVATNPGPHSWESINCKVSLRIESRLSSLSPSASLPCLKILAVPTAIHRTATAIVRTMAKMIIFLRRTNVNRLSARAQILDNKWPGSDLDSISGFGTLLEWSRSLNCSSLFATTVKLPLSFWFGSISLKKDVRKSVLSSGAINLGALLLVGG